MENLLVMVTCVIIGVTLTKFHAWSVSKAKSENNTTKDQVVGG